MSREGRKPIRMDSYIFLGAGYRSVQESPEPENEYGEKVVNIDVSDLQTV